VSTVPQAQTKAQAKTEDPAHSKDDSYTPPTAEEIAPMRPEYLTELAKIHEPPEMSRKPMQIRKAESPGALRLWNAMSAVSSPEKATHQQRATGLPALRRQRQHRREVGRDPE